jgi:two-component system, chemotaxis family, sensor kinase CheA
VWVHSQKMIGALVSKDISKYVPSGEMADYLQMYLDETGEQLEALVEKLLALEKNPADAVCLNDAFRLVHTIKGSSALMGFESITQVTHHLESHFERVRSGSQTLDPGLMDLSLRCVDFLRECNRRLREGEALGSAPELLDALKAVGAATPAVQARAARCCRVLIHFEAGLPLVDLKAQLTIARLAALGVVQRTLPSEKELARLADQMPLQVLLESERGVEEIRHAADVAGVALIELEEGVHEFLPSKAPAPPPTAPARPIAPPVEEAPADEPEEEAERTAAAPVASVAVESKVAKAKLAETVRVDIERLDNLMNLAGELVVNKARFVQIARQMSPAFKKSSLAGRTRAFGESMRRALTAMKVRDGASAVNLNELEAEIGAIEEHARLWEESRRQFAHVTEAIDQLTRVSDSLQRGVLDTRMVPVAPLFNRFKRVVRDISLELNKKVHLEIKGEKTELDKRMIDELGDPLIHLVRNSIDHGIESAEVRMRRGKPEFGSICLEAAHSGNNVFIYVRDDGGGIDTDKIRRRVRERGLVAPGLLDSLSEQDLIDFIWHPGFSTAEVISGISGRGVGMDIVKTRIAELNGTIEIQHVTGQGSTFIIRLPLTLAIIRSLLFRLAHGIFAVPIDNVREIVSVPIDQIIAVHGRQTFEARGEFIPLVDIDDVFQWHAQDHTHTTRDMNVKRVNVVILHSANKTMGLRVNELLGGQDIVIKSLAENFVHIRGLSGASILGDGSVCLLLDVSAAIDLAGGSRQQTAGSR